jgi:hypothetical protein
LCLAFLQAHVEELRGQLYALDMKLWRSRDEGASLAGQLKSCAVVHKKTKEKDEQRIEVLKKYENHKRSEGGWGWGGGINVSGKQTFSLQTSYLFGSF